jgi:DNA-binding CsgD family transcriptional regulator
MSKKKGEKKGGQRTFDNYRSGQFAKHEQESLEQARKLLRPIVEKHHLSDLDIQHLLKPHIPLSIFNKKLTILEAIVLHLKRNNYSLRQIAQLIHRDERNVWHIFTRAEKKHPQKLICVSDFLIPLALLDSHLSAQESVVSFLKKQGMKYVEIAQLLHRNQRTIWTVYRRAQKKEGRHE